MPPQFDLKRGMKVDFFCLLLSKCVLFMVTDKISLIFYNFKYKIYGKISIYLSTPCADA